MALPGLKVRQFKVEVATLDYVISGTIEPVGTIMAFIGSRDRKAVHLKDVSASALNSASVLGLFSADDLWVTRQEIMAVRFVDQLSPNTVQLLPHRSKLRIYLPNYVIQGTVAHGSDAPMAEMFELMSADWIPVIDAQMFPLVQTRARLGRESATIILARKFVQFYQPVKE
jgi:hypothetical protein